MYRRKASKTCIAVMLVMFVLFNTAFVSYATFDPLDRNGSNILVPSQPPAPDVSDASSSSVPQLIDAEELTKEEERSANTNIVDTTIYLTGILIWIADLLYVSLATLALVMPAVSEPIIKVFTFGKSDHIGDSWGRIITKFIIIAAIGTLFTAGWIKVILGQFYGWFLSRHL